jgi:phenylalanine-4-hydroxylase
MMQTTKMDPPDFRTAQDWSAYTAGQHDVWRILYQRRMRTLADTGSRLFLSGAEKIGLSSERVPDLGDVNARLAKLTGWRAIAVSGFIPAHDFFACLSRREFPTTIIVRPREQLDYLPEPDIFHDVFGHVPLHADPVFADFLQHFGRVAARARSELETTWMARLFWFTVEFGLIREAGATKIYGSGLISSHADAAHAVAPDRDRRAFLVDDVIDQEFRIDHVQDVLFVVDDFAQLFDAVAQMEQRIGVA